MQISEALRAANGGAIYRPWGCGDFKLVIKPGGVSRFSNIDAGIQYGAGAEIQYHPNWEPMLDDLIADDWELLEEGAHISGEG